MNKIALPRPHSIIAFRRKVLMHYRKRGRHELTWRHAKDPYKIFVSEVMLQQTQVPRVIGKYEEFLHEFPTIRKLAAAPLLKVLRIWSGLGYNRRARFLHEAAKIIRDEYDGEVPREHKKLMALPGIGAYTASAIRTFAFNELDVFIETNIRAAFIHHFFSDSLFSHGRRNIRTKYVTDAEILPIAKRAMDGQEPREWHWALMDYGTHLKKVHSNPTRRSAHYIRQTAFRGSMREARGAIIRALLRADNIKGLRNPYIDRFDAAFESLAEDRLVKRERGQWRIA